MSKKQQKQVSQPKSRQGTGRSAAPVFNWKPYGVIIQIAVIVISFAICYHYIFDKKINVNGDNAGYYLLAKSIHKGAGYTYYNDITHSPTDTFPPGYPFFLAVFMFISQDIGFLSFLNGLLFLGSLLLLWDLVKRFGVGWQVAMVTVFFTLCNFHIAGSSITTMSEVPYLFFTLLTLFILVRLNPEESMMRNRNFYLLLLCIVASYHTRSTGLALLLGIVFYLLTYRRWKESLTLLAGFVLLSLPWFMRGKMLGIPSAYREAVVKVNPYKPELGNVNMAGMITRFGKNFERYYSKEIPSGLFPCFDINYKVTAETYLWVWGTIFILLMLFGLIKLPKYRSLMLGYFGASFGILLLWPEVWFGTRFMMPMIPLMILLVIWAVVSLFNFLMKKMKLSISFNALVLLPLVYFYIIPYKGYNQSQDYQMYPLLRLHNQAILDYQPNWKRFFDMAEWAKDSLPQNAVVACKKPELFHVFSDRFTCYFPLEENDKKLLEEMTKSKVTHVVVEQLGFSATGRYLVPAIQKNPTRFKIVKHMTDPDTYLLEYK